MKTSILLSVFIFSLLEITFSQVEFVLTSIPENTPEEDEIYIAGNFNGWDPGDTDFILTVNNDGLHSIELNGNGTIEFKFTRGDWATVEGNESGHFLPNRLYTFSDDTIAFFEILSWEDTGGPDTTHTTTENVSIMDEDFYMPQLDRNRRIWIYLPLDYETTDKMYPVLYMHDGQNLFDNLTSFIGEWGVDESLNELYDSGYQTPIVVGIDNGGVLRLDEYSPWINPEYGGGDGDEYIDFIVETLKPYIDENYRTKSDRSNTGIMGSSMGGLISFYAGLQYPDVFSRLGVFSPSFWFDDSVFTMAENFDKQHDFKIYMLVGHLEGSGMENNQGAMYDLLLDNEFTEDEVVSIISPDGQHSEWFWQREFPEVYLWMFNDYESNIQQSETKNLQIILYPNPASKQLFLNFSDNNSIDINIQLIDISGKTLSKQLVENSTQIDISGYESGIYFIRFTEKSETITKMLIIKD